MTVLLAGGDLVLGAVGTVTYVDGADRARLRPPVPRRGPRALPARRRLRLPDHRRPDHRLELQARRARHAPGHDRRPTAPTASPPGVGPVEGITAVATATDTARGTESTVRTTIAPDERTVPIVAGLLQDEPAVRVRDGVGRRDADAADRDHQPRPGEADRLPQRLRRRRRRGLDGERPAAADAHRPDAERRPPGPGLGHLGHRAPRDRACAPPASSAPPSAAPGRRRAAHPRAAPPAVAVVAARLGARAPARRRGPRRRPPCA